jgi:molybdate transport system substrate-binding protein
MRHLSESGAATAIGSTQSTEILNTPGVVLCGALPPGYELATIYSAGVTSQSRHAADAKRLIALLTAMEGRELRARAGFLELGKH